MAISGRHGLAYRKDFEVHHLEAFDVDRAVLQCSPSLRLS